MANKTTVTKGYLQGGKHIVKFFESEYGSYKTYANEMKKIRDEVKKLSPDGEELDENDKKVKKIRDRIKAVNAKYHSKFTPIVRYGISMAKLYDSKENVNKKTIEKLIIASSSIKKGNVFTDSEMSWHSEEGAKAVKKFTDMIVENDLKKFMYYHNCLEKGSFEGLTLEQIMDTPVPKLREPAPNDKEALKNKMLELAEKLEEADAIMHVNSSEFKAMKSAVKHMNEVLAADAAEAEIGKHLEKLQAASMKYVRAKGVGTQSTQLGKDRMAVALELCGTATGYMDCYASEERVQQISDFEKNTVKKEFSRNGTFDYRVAINEIELEAMEAVLDDEDMEMK